MRRLWLAVGLIGLWWWWHGNGGDSPPETRGRAQAAVLRDGFALQAGDGRVLVLDRKGRPRAEHRVSATADLRVVGTRVGPAAGMLHERTLRMIDLAKNKTVGVWGKSVRTLCEGVATNDERFAIGWLESDDTFWFVHGDTSPGTSAAAPELAAIASASAKQWCGIASAEANIALFWRERDRLYITTCTRKKCSSLPGVVSLDQRATLLGFGCLKNACLIAVREPGGKARFSYATESGAVKWSKPLPTTVHGVTIVGVGDRAFALGYASDSGAEVLRVERDSKTARVWQSDRADVPTLAWSQGQLLVGHEGRPTLVPLPR